MAAGDVKVVLTKNRAFNCDMFDGADDSVSIPHHWRQLGANLPTGFTVSAWVKLKTYGEGGNGRVLDKSDSVTGGNGFYIYVVSSGKLAANINGGTARSCTAGTVMPTGAWYHIVVTFSTHFVNFYVNAALSGAADQDVVQSVTAITTTNNMFIGNQALAGSRTFDGAIRSVKVWDRVLTTAEIAQDYAGYTPPTPIHNFKLGGDYADYGTCGVTATADGTVTRTVEDRISVATRAQRVAATDKWMCYRGLEGQVGIVNIE